jgi:predicted nucleic acid-binding protein
MERISFTDIIETPGIINRAKSIQELSIKSKDALHIACAIKANADYFITTDDIILKKLKNFDEITVINPLRFIENLD